MNRRAILAIARKDIQAITANLQVWLPMLIVPLILGIGLPLGLVLAFRFGAESLAPADVQAMLAWLDKLPAGELAAVLSTMTELNQKLIYVSTNYMLAPFFLMIPLMTASVIAADSFAGEKERGTLETLLFAPVDLRSLFTGKVLASLVPAVVISLVTFLLCALSVNLAAWPLFHRVFFPQFNWLPLMLLVIPGVSLLAILINVFISARVATFQAAYQMGGTVVLPVLLLGVGQATGALVLSDLVVTLVGLVVAAIDVLLLWQVLCHMNRNQLFASQVR
ncbi:ABC-type Na+ efflux pump permease subunit [Symbiobacterium terraclitae]|uniref:ABC-type Na+ efflux pump permease subunit n=1 Tax=Symbiobacterium terraclitae TaxID=557451 RepID=A0ABS4JQS0_9FIRM|nr:ABC transporter permease subunit [Symbiobacterium terraclitae]MBP2016804.1 ABC-type Na+ efflux pump permease subunit [Symbiobacterium terraclitae]